MDAAQLRNAARGVTRAGENVLWVGEPRQGVFLRRSDILVVPFTLAWAGFAVFWTILATSGGAPLFFTLWGCMFVAVGLYLVFGRFLVDAWQRNGTIYVLTDRRLVVHAAKRGELSTPLDQVGSIEFVGQSGERGTIRYGAARSTHPMSFFELPTGWPGAARYQRPMLDSISDGRRVYDQLLAAVQTAGSPPPG